VVKDLHLRRNYNSPGFPFAPHRAYIRNNSGVLSLDNQWASQLYVLIMFQKEKLYVLMNLRGNT